MKRLVLIGLLLATPVVAQTAPHTVDMTTILLDQHGVPIPDMSQRKKGDDDCSHCPPLTLGGAASTALLTDRQEDASTPAVDKAKRAALALRVMDAKAATLTVKETGDILDRMKMWGPIVDLRAVTMLDPNALSDAK